MSDKLTSNRLEELILEMLQEEPQSLNEFTTKTFKIASGKTEPSAKEIKKKLAKGGTSGPRSPSKDNILKVAATDGNATDFSKQDVIDSKGDKTLEDILNILAGQKNTNTAIKRFINKTLAGTDGDGTGDGTDGSTTGASLAASLGLTKKTNMSDWSDAIVVLYATNKAHAQLLFDEFVQIKYTDYGKTPPTGKTSPYQVALKVLTASGKPTGDGAKLLHKALTDLANIPDYQPKSMTRPDFTTGPVITKSQSTKAGKHTRGYSSGLQVTFDGLFKNANTSAKRLEAIEKFSSAMVNDKDFATTFGTDKAKFLNAVVAMDWISAMAKEMDSGASAYVFEAFCAMIHGGAGIGGANKAGDFTVWASNGDLDTGSAKWLASDKATQAVSGFNVDEPVLYVQAKKRKPSGGATSDPDEIGKIDIFVYEIEFKKKVALWNDHQKSNNVAKGTNGVNISWQKKKSTRDDNHGGMHDTVQIVMEPDMSKPDYTLYVASKANKDSFKSSLNATLKTATDQTQKKAVKAAFDLMNQYFAKTYEADTSIKKYLGMSEEQGLTPNTLAMGTKALSAIQVADEKQVALFNELGGGSKVDTLSGGGNRTLEESKLQSLDDLIAETMRDIKKKRKK